MEITKEQKQQMRMIIYIERCDKQVHCGDELTDKQISKLEKILDELDPVVLSEELGESYNYYADLCEDILCSI